MLDDLKFVYLAIVCSTCCSILDILSTEKEPLYIDKKCDCGSMGFVVIRINLKLITEKPKNQEPFFESDGHTFYLPE